MIRGGKGPGGGGGRGRGRGMRRGGGRGRGAGFGRTMGIGAQTGLDGPRCAPGDGQSFSHPAWSREESEKRELVTLRVRAEAMAAQLRAINARISEIQRGRRSSSAVVPHKEVSREPSGDTEGERLTAIVTAAGCVGCAICVETCPQAAIVVDEVAFIDRQRCTGCGSCTEECPNAAIRLVKLQAAVS